MMRLWIYGRYTSVGSLALWLILGMALPAWAHALGVECKLQNRRVLVEAYYEDDTPAQRARVQVRDGRNQIIAEGRTDDQGRYVFDRPAPGRYQVVVDDGAGHREQVTMQVPELNGPGASYLSEGPRREAFTRFPWLKLGIGLTAVGGFSLAFWLTRRWGRSASQRG